MGQNDFVEGFAIRDVKGIHVNTVSDTRRAAIVNWLVTEKRLMILDSWSDEMIDQAWDVRRGSAEAIKVRIYAK